VQLIQQIINGLMLGGILAFVAVAFTLTIGMLNFLNFTIPALFMIAGMVTWALSSTGSNLLGWGWHWTWAAAAGIGCAVLASLLIERFTYRYMKARFGDATEHALPLVSSLGFLIFFEHLASSIWGSDPKRFELPFKDTNLRIGELIIGVPHLVSLLLAIALVAMLNILLVRTKVGRALRAIAENPSASTLMGVEVQHIVPVVWHRDALHGRRDRHRCHCGHGVGRAWQYLGSHCRRLVGRLGQDFGHQHLWRRD
jgi:branched-chain amino acid transport system permease protein